MATLAMYTLRSGSAFRETSASLSVQRTLRAPWQEIPVLGMLTEAHDIVQRAQVVALRAIVRSQDLGVVEARIDA